MYFKLSQMADIAQFWHILKPFQSYYWVLKVSVFN